MLSSSRSIAPPDVFMTVIVEATWKLRRAKSSRIVASYSAVRSRLVALTEPGVIAFVAGWRRRWRSARRVCRHRVGRAGESVGGVVTPVMTAGLLGAGVTLGASADASTCCGATRSNPTAASGTRSAGTSSHPRRRPRPDHAVIVAHSFRGELDTRRLARMATIERSGADRGADPGRGSRLLGAIRAALPGLKLLDDPADREAYRNDETAYLQAGSAACGGAARIDGRGGDPRPPRGRAPRPGRAARRRLRAQRAERPASRAA